jgi:dUTP pyrophosphatase
MHSEAEFRRYVKRVIRDEADTVEVQVVKFRRFRPSNDLPLPEYKTAKAAGLDLQADLSGFSLTADGEKPSVAIAPGARTLIPTGFAITLPQGREAQVRSRSGLALKHGVVVLNSPGTIDADYVGEVGVVLINHGDRVFVVKHGDRIAQLVIAPVDTVATQETQDTTVSERGDGGFGSTGV